MGSKKLNKMGIVALSSGEESSRTWSYQNTTLHWWNQLEWYIHCPRGIYVNLSSADVINLNFANVIRKNKLSFTCKFDP